MHTRQIMKYSFYIMPIIVLLVFLLVGFANAGETQKFDLHCTITYDNEKFSLIGKVKKYSFDLNDKRAYNHYIDEFIIIERLTSSDIVLHNDRLDDGGHLTETINRMTGSVSVHSNIQS